MDLPDREQRRRDRKLRREQRRERKALRRLLAVKRKALLARVNDNEATRMWVAGEHDSEVERLTIELQIVTDGADLDSPEDAAMVEEARARLDDAKDSFAEQVASFTEDLTGITSRLAALQGDVFGIHADRSRGGPGARVLGLAEDHRLGDADLRPGDVIVAFGGREVARPADLIALAADVAPGDAVTLEVLRDGERVGVSWIAQAPADGAAP